MARYLNFFGLLMVLVGSTLLFVASISRKQLGNTIFAGNEVSQFEPDATHQDLPEAWWRPIAQRFFRRIRYFNNVGFGLLAAGTLIQIIAIFAAD